MDGRSQVRLFKEAHLDDEDAYVNWCLEVGLLAPGGTCKASTCRRRQHQMVLCRRQDQGLPHWRCSHCHKTRTVTSDSAFIDLHLSLGKALMVIECFAYGLSYEETRRACVFDARDAPVANSTIADWFGYLRDRLVDAEGLEEGQGQLGGPGRVMQVDEALLGRRKYHRGGVLPGTWVLGMLDEAGGVRMETLTNRNAQTLKEIIQRHIHPGSTVHTDGWRGYSSLRRLGYNHRTVNHSVEFVGADGTHKKTSSPSGGRCGVISAQKESGLMTLGST